MMELAEQAAFASYVHQARFQEGLAAAESEGEKAAADAEEPAASDDEELDEDFSDPEAADSEDSDSEDSDSDIDEDMVARVKRAVGVDAPDDASCDTASEDELPVEDAEAVLGPRPTKRPRL